MSNLYVCMKGSVPIVAYDTMDECISNISILNRKEAMKRLCLLQSVPQTLCDSSLLGDICDVLGITSTEIDNEIGTDYTCNPVSV
jgi:hypothetical protein